MTDFGAGPGLAWVWLEQSLSSDGQQCGRTEEIEDSWIYADHTMNSIHVCHACHSQPDWG